MADAAMTPVTPATVAGLAASATAQTSLVLEQTWPKGSANASAARADSERASEKANAATATVREITERLSGEMIDFRTVYICAIREIISWTLVFKN